MEEDLKEEDEFEEREDDDEREWFLLEDGHFGVVKMVFLGVIMPFLLGVFCSANEPISF